MLSTIQHQIQVMQSKIETQASQTNSKNLHLSVYQSEELIIWQGNAPVTQQWYVWAFGMY